METAESQVNQQINPQNQNPQKNQESETKKSKTTFNIGVIVSDTNLEDIEYYNEQFKAINAEFGDKVKLIFYGYSKEKVENDFKMNILNGVTYDYVKPVSLVHYFKQLNALEIDLLFIPLINNIYNATSENYNKFLEVGIYKIPIITVDMYPYNIMVQHEINGFIYSSKETFIDYLKSLFSKAKMPIIKLCGSHAHDLIVKDFNFSEENVKLLSRVFSVPTKTEQTETK